MQNTHARRFPAIIGGIFAAICALAALRTGFDFAKHETDMLHLVDIVLRLESDARIHEDVMTPLGQWAFMPFVLLKQAGLGLGAALKWGQVAVAGLLLGPVIWVGLSRMRSAPLAVGFGAMVLLLASGMVYGGADTKLSLSMHYNRWAWAIVFLPLALVVLPPQRRGDWLDAGVIGAAMAALVLIKATYFVAFAPAVILGLLLRRELKVLALALLIGIGILGVQTLFSGFGFWQGYVSDLMTVAASEVRPQPGKGWSQVALSPAYAVGTLLAVGSVIWLRAVLKDEPAGLTLAVLLPGAIYVSYQNFGNDQLWLLLWGLVFMALGFLHVARKGQLLVWGALSLALVAPPALNIAISPLRHVLQPETAFAPLLPRHPDLRGVEARFESVAGQWPLGEEDGQCKLASGAVGHMREMAARLEAEGHGGKGVYVAGLFNTFWLFGDFPPLKGGAPWYYGGLPGIGEAELLVLPECSFGARYKELAMREISARGIGTQAIHSDELMTVYRLQLPK